MYHKLKLCSNINAFNSLESLTPNGSIAITVSIDIGFLDLTNNGFDSFLKYFIN